MKVYELLSDIRNRDLVLPEFQREYVWTKEQAKQLMVSLWKGYPIGSLLFWKTDNPPELKNVVSLPERLGTIQVILDGQQRLTTLYMLIEVEVPPYYNQSDIQTDITGLYYNLNDGDFQYFQHDQCLPTESIRLLLSDAPPAQRAYEPVRVQSGVAKDLR